MEVINAIGRRKSAVARVYLTAGKGDIKINEKDFKEYIPVIELQAAILQPFKLTGNEGKYDVVATLDGGGVRGQAEALRLGISRALLKIDANHRVALKSEGLLRRDPRRVERKKPGQPGARKKFQFSKR